MILTLSQGSGVKPPEWLHVGIMVGRCMLCEVDAAAVPHNLINDIRLSLPAINFNSISMVDRSSIFSKIHPQSLRDDDDDNLVTPAKVTRIVHRLKRNRGPGLDGFTVEYLYGLQFSLEDKVNSRRRCLKSMLFLFRGL